MNLYICGNDVCSHIRRYVIIYTHIHIYTCHFWVYMHTGNHGLIGPNSRSPLLQWMWFRISVGMCKLLGHTRLNHESTSGECPISRKKKTSRLFWVGWRWEIPWLSSRGSVGSDWIIGLKTMESCDFPLGTALLVFGFYRSCGGACLVHWSPYMALYVSSLSGVIWDDEKNVYNNQWDIHHINQCRVSVDKF